MPELQTKDLYWIAGLFEGEGTIGWHTSNQKYKSPKIAVSMVDRDVIEKFANLMGFGTICVIPQRKSVNPECRLFHWEGTGANAVGMMMTIYSLLGERRQARVRKMIDEWSGVKRKVEYCISRCKRGRTFSFAATTL